jgi:alpha-tubulin suppressor-like RCC1 family protein
MGRASTFWGGARGTLVLKSDGTVWTWGANFGGKLGGGTNSTNLGHLLVPTEVQANCPLSSPPAWPKTLP